MTTLMDYSMVLILSILLSMFFLDFYKKFFYIRNDTDKIDLMKRYVELERLRNKQ